MAKASWQQLQELGLRIRRGQIPEWKIPAVFGIVEDDPLGTYLRLVEEARKELISAEQVQALIEGKDEALGIFKVTVDYGLTLEQMIAAGCYDWADDDIADERFLVFGRDKVERDLILVHLNRVAMTDEVLAELNRRGLLPAEIEDLLALGAAKPELQCQFMIMELGLSWTCSRNNLDYFAFIDYDQGTYGRVLRLLYCGNGWDKDQCFLAVRKDAA